MWRRDQSIRAVRGVGLACVCFVVGIGSTACAESEDDPASVFIDRGVAGAGGETVAWSAEFVDGEVHLRPTAHPESGLAAVGITDVVDDFDVLVDTGPGWSKGPDSELFVVWVLATRNVEADHVLLRFADGTEIGVPLVAAQESLQVGATLLPGWRTASAPEVCVAVFSAAGTQLEGSVGGSDLVAAAQCVDPGAS